MIQVTALMEGVRMDHSLAQVQRERMAVVAAIVSV